MYVSKMWESVARRGRKRFIASWGQDMTYLSLHPMPPPQGRGQRSKVILLPTSAQDEPACFPDGCKRRCRKLRQEGQIMLIYGEIELRKFGPLQLLGEFLKDLYIKEIRNRVEDRPSLYFLF
jgi:hypothetical protein